MTRAEHSVIVIMLARQDRLLKTLANILRRQGLLTEGDLASVQSSMAQSESDDLEGGSQVAKLYLEAARKMLVDIPAQDRGQRP